MSVKGGRLELRYTLTTTWDATFTDSGGATAVSIPSGNHYPVDIITAIDGDVGPAWTISIDDGENGTGRCTIHSTNTPWSITWTSTALRDALGFTANITNVSAAQTGTNAVAGLWLPGEGIGKWSMYGDSANGSLVTDWRATVGPTGQVRAFCGNSFRVHEGIRWEGVPSHRAMDHLEVVSGESFESFALDAMTGRKSYIPVNAYVRLYWDADVDGTYAVGRLQWPARFDVRRLVENWNGRFIVDLPKFVVEG
jgi:hypothetical protein